MEIEYRDGTKAGFLEKLILAPVILPIMAIAYITAKNAERTIMQTLEYTTVDKSTWGEGEWQNEPDKKQWLDPATNLPCLIVRSPHSGALCGYVGVSKSHPYYKKDYDDCDVDVHGGLTFANTCSPNPNGICHKIEEGEDDEVWWLGFDSAHCYDKTPASDACVKKFEWHYEDPDSVYRNFGYITREVQKLALQLKAIT